MNNQPKLLAALTSQVGRKILTGVTGVLLVLFVIGHLSGNLTLLSRDPSVFNTYARFLHRFGTLVYVVEVGLAAVILLHAYLGIALAMRTARARKNGYEVYKSKGGPSRQTLASRTMVYTGIILMVFLVIHIVQFRFGPSTDLGYVVDIKGEESRDLYRLVYETFRNIWWVIFYVGVMILLGFHLRHGVWSALQSLGAMKPRYSKVIFSLALLFGVLLAVGFLILPIYMYVISQGGAA